MNHMFNSTTAILILILSSLPCALKLSATPLGITVVQVKKVRTLKARVSPDYSECVDLALELRILELVESHRQSRGSLHSSRHILSSLGYRETISLSYRPSPILDFKAGTVDVGPIYRGFMLDHFSS